MQGDTKVIFLTNQQFENRLKTIATKNLKKYGRTPTATSLSNFYFQECIICVHESDGDNCLLEIDKNKYKEIRTHVMLKFSPQEREGPDTNDNKH